MDPRSASRGNHLAPAEAARHRHRPRASRDYPPLHEIVNELLLSPMGRRDWPMRFYSPQRLFSVEARRSFVRPDLASLPQI